MYIMLQNIRKFIFEKICFMLTFKHKKFYIIEQKCCSKSLPSFKHFLSPANL